ncbi:hypothetical protein [Photobacterium kishitanii]|uniref:Uncharacterized protein n=1 Tax=Photobacterium kishitanii TaxID=318456 RepID=A0A2T3KM47_9GAMM|nr:hypothetical protein [Photobacterium kishitanii]PSV00861.1 hypothetical protein C9J27_02210 [Photobacterium kishitanii]
MENTVFSDCQNRISYFEQKFDEISILLREKNPETSGLAHVDKTIARITIICQKLKNIIPQSTSPEEIATMLFNINAASLELLNIAGSFAIANINHSAGFSATLHLNFLSVTVLSIATPLEGIIINNYISNNH